MIATNKGQVGEVGVKTRDFQGFLPKLMSISQLILYESKLLSSSNAVISTYIHNIDSSLSNSLYNNLAIIYFC